MILKTKPELVCPAGDWPSLCAASSSGADSVYFGVKDFNMRAAAVNFGISEVKKVMDFLHKNGKKGYLTLNTIVMNSQLSRAEKILKACKEAEADAVILWDMAVFAMARGLGLDVHISTQAGIANIEALSFYASLGARRVVLARECTLAAIKKMARQIRERKLACDIETFVHGAMCLSVSGRCFLSQYTFGKSANQGRCLQPCRRQYRIRDVDGEAEYTAGHDYLLSPKDLCAIDFIDELIVSGIGAFKIEGRKRSPEYIKVVTESYREAIDLFFAGRLRPASKKRLRKNLSSVYNRGFGRGFYFGRPQDAPSRRLEHTHEKIFLGEVVKFYKKISVAEVFLRNGSLTRGEELLFTGKTTPASFMCADSLEQNHAAVARVARGERFGIKLPFAVKPQDKVFIWREKPNPL